jgi:hypothetical protein
MNPAQLAQRIAALDWNLPGLTLQHLLAVTAAVETLKDMPVENETNVIPMLPTVLPVLRPEALRGCEYVPARRVTLTRLDGTPFADALCSRADRWEWVQEVVTEELRCYPEQVGCMESADGEGDLVTVDGLPVFRIG